MSTVKIPEEASIQHQGAATAGNNRAVHIVRYSLPTHSVAMCGAKIPHRPQTTQNALPKCGRCF